MERRRRADGPVVGIVGAGQLARMTYQAAISLGIEVRLLAARPDDGAARIAAAVELGSPMDDVALTRFVAGNTVTTFDHELVPAVRLAALEALGHCLRPGAGTVALAQNKRRQRAELGALGLPVPPFRFVSTLTEIDRFGATHGWPMVLKAGRGGYDGRGVWILSNAGAAEEIAPPLLARPELELLVEQWVPIEREIATIVARRPGGEARVFPVVETIQTHGICHELLAPARIAPALADEAAAIAIRIADAIDAIGLLAVELFVADGRLIINELAARPHNSGHYTIEGCVTSQFAQHLRAILDWPLGDPSLVAPAVATVNVLGATPAHDPLVGLPAALAVPGACVHLYGKAARPGRKLGHVTVIGRVSVDVRRRAHRAAALLAGNEEQIRV